MMKVLVALLIVCPTVVFAHGNKLAMTSDSLAIASEMFEKEFPVALKTFSGVKAWPDVDKILVKIYYNANTQFVQYQCVMSGEVIKCDKSPAIK